MERKKEGGRNGGRERKKERERKYEISGPENRPFTLREPLSPAPQSVIP